MSTKRKAKPVAKDETIKTPAEPAASVAAPTLTPEEHAIYQRVMAESDEWRTLSEGDMEEFSLSESIFKLPPEAIAKERLKEMKFRWITRSRERVDQIRAKPVPLKWYICNRSQTPFLSKYVDPTTGSVNREDQMLVFKPWWMWERELAIKRDLADSRDRSGDIKSRDGVSRSGVHMSAGVRDIDSQEKFRAEISGDDIVMGDEAAIDRSRGISHGEGIDDLIDS